MTTTTETPTFAAGHDRAVDNAQPKPIERVSIICSKGTLDMAYPGLVMANGARMNGIEAMVFFTFWGLDIITESKIDHLHVATVGNPSMPIPTMVGGLPGMEAMASKMMKKQMEELDIPPVREFIEMLHDAGAELYACRMAMDMFKLEEKDLVPQIDDVLTVMDFYDKSAGSQIIFI
ncbi:MAG: DsrE/DsrF/DrsH-like family protein [Acidobacteriota bacterium]|jgi:peroxiredoxin family protein